MRFVDREDEAGLISGTKNSGRVERKFVQGNMEVNGGK